ncbi:Two-pore potassium channel 3 [Raphanus sativus]|uniref:Two-pore potassium channel 3 n=1 Tax=Raphanus sativus TaxID=3726 RepID=A0A6J0N3E0_RAPSA|nr:two-pore potassium channel 3 [Raphanus sativus]KAJ4899953.1 Two-pore potassium channel 3 [Raphanus sativus]
MADGNNNNNKDNIDPLLQYMTIPRMREPPPILFPVPEEGGEVAIPMPMTPKEFKDRLIFGPFSRSPRDSSQYFDSLSQKHSPSSSTTATAATATAATAAAAETFSDASSADPLLPPPPQQPEPWSHGHALHRSKTAPAMAVINDHNHHPTPHQKDLDSSRSVVRQAFALLVVYLSLGVLIYWLNRDHYVVNQTHPVVDGLYFCIVTMCTIGYGDITPNSVVTKLFSIMFVLVGFGFIDILLSGMVSYVLDLQESYMLDSAKRRDEPDHKRRSYIIDVKKGRMRIRLKVALALGVVVLCIAVGVGIMHFIEGIDWLDSFYLSVMSVTTVGYGDRAFKTLPGRLFAAVWLLVSTLAVARAFLYLAEARVDKRNRERAKKVLREAMSVSQFFAADIDNNGCVSKAEYVIYKLKEMEKITDKDITPISKQFDKLDRCSNGKITLGDLLESSSGD